MLVFAAVAAVTSAVSPRDSPASLTVGALVILTSTIVIFWGAARQPRESRKFWMMFATYQLLINLGGVVYTAVALAENGGDPPMPNLSDFVYFASYLAGFSALMMLIRSRHPGRDREAWIDTLIITLSAGSIIATFILAPILLVPYATPSATAIAIMYPLLDLILLSALIRLFTNRDRRNTVPTTLITTSVGIYLIADLIYNSAVVHRGVGDPSPTWLTALYLIATCLAASASISPGSAHITDPVDAIDDTPQVAASSPFRIIGLTLGAMVAPALLAYLSWFNVSPELMKLVAVISITIVGLVIWRVRLLLLTVEGQSMMLSRQARTDALTGLPNRRTWDYQLIRVETKLIDEPEPVVLALLDLDHFKQYNDTHGHQDADVLLAAVGGAWQEAIGDRGFIARYGGEEFGCLIMGEHVPDAENILNEVRLATPQGQTVSIGYAELREGEALVDAVGRADTAMYEAKREGRNCVVAYSESLSERDNVLR